jgi:anti-sigma B factor antagonist
MASSRDATNFQTFPAESGAGLRLVGELDMATVAELRAALHELPRDGGGLVLDLSGLSFMDASGLHVLEEYAGTLNGTGPLVLDNVPSHLARLFVLTGVDLNPAIDLRRGDGRG